MNKILLVFGTRPELIKLSPVINEFCERKMRDRLFVVNSNQHYDLVKPELDFFNIKPDFSFDLTRTGNDLSNLTGLLMNGFYLLKQYLKKTDVNIIASVAQGDTATTFCTSLFSFFEKIPFHHVEAGLRTFDFYHPFPEEFFRKTISSTASFHYVPTAKSAENLQNEKVDGSRVIITGNTVIDNLVKYKTGDTETQKDTVLVTLHRNENMGTSFNAILSDLIRICTENPDLSFIWVLHPNKSKPEIKSNPPLNLQFADPLSYQEMIKLYRRCACIITDSGGLQEEACFMDIPVLLYRMKSERTEGIEKGISRYIEYGKTSIRTFISDYNNNLKGKHLNTYGCGKASKLIADNLTSMYLTNGCS